MCAINPIMIRINLVMPKVTDGKMPDLAIMPRKIERGRAKEKENNAKEIYMLVGEIAIMGSMAAAETTACPKENHCAYSSAFLLSDAIRNPIAIILSSFMPLNIAKKIKMVAPAEPYLSILTLLQWLRLRTGMCFHTNRFRPRLPSSTSRLAFGLWCHDDIISFLRLVAYRYLSVVD